jgi:hypothetical protein
MWRDFAVVLTTAITQGKQRLPYMTLVVVVMVPVHYCCHMSDYGNNSSSSDGAWPRLAAAGR